MQHRLLRLLMMLAVLVALGESTARADLVNYSYHWSMTPTSVFSGGSGSVQFAVNPDNTPPITSLGGNTWSIPAATVTSTIVQGATDSYNSAFSLKLTLTDPSNVSTDLTFKGTMAGTLSGSTNSVATTVTNPLPVLLAGHLYQFALNPQAFVPLPSVGVTGGSTVLLSATATELNINGGPLGGGNPPPGPSNTPEPSSLVLGGIAVFGFAARRWSRNRRQRA